jgi:hypothetical protein
MIRYLFPPGTGLNSYNARKLALGLVFPILSYVIADLVLTRTMFKKVKLF